MLGSASEGTISNPGRRTKRQDAKSFLVRLGGSKAAIRVFNNRITNYIGTIVGEAQCATQHIEINATGRRWTCRKRQRTGAGRGRATDYAVASDHGCGR